jgi:hypothetical protein
MREAYRQNLIEMHLAIATWQARRDSNPQPPDLESGALPLELLAFEDFPTLFPYAADAADRMDRIS